MAYDLVPSHVLAWLCFENRHSSGRLAAAHTNRDPDSQIGLYAPMMRKERRKECRETRDSASVAPDETCSRRDTAVRAGFDARNWHPSFPNVNTYPLSTRATIMKIGAAATGLLLA